MTAKKIPVTDFGDNLSEAATLLDGEDVLAAPPPVRARAAPPKTAKAKAVEPRIRIMLEDNDQIPPGGQFVSADGRAFLIQAGYEVNVPYSVLDVLDHAIMSVPVKDRNDTVIGYRDRLRFPYRVIREGRGA
jgi:hypothetical protein